MRFETALTLLLLAASCTPRNIKPGADPLKKGNVDESVKQEPTDTSKSESAKGSSDGKSGDEGNKRTAQSASKDAAKKAKAASSYETVGKPHEGVATAAPQIVKISIPLQPKECYSFSVQLDKDMQAESLEVFDPAGTRVHQGRAIPTQKTESLCPSVEGEYRAEVKVIKGLGKVSLQAYKLKPPAPYPTATESRQLLSSFAQSVAEGQPPVSPIYTMVGPPEDAHFLVKLERSACYNLVTAADSGVEELHVTLLEPAGHKVLEDGAASAKKHMTYCVESGGLYRASLHIARGSGEVAFQVFQSPAKYTPPTRSVPGVRVTAAQHASEPPKPQVVWPAPPRF